MADAITIRTIHPSDPEGKIRPAFLLIDHFGAGKHAINFGGISTQNFSADDLPWEFSDDIDRLEFEEHVKAT